MKRELEALTVTKGDVFCVCVCVSVYVWNYERPNKQKPVKTREEGEMAGQETGQIYRVPFQFLKAVRITLTPVIIGGVGRRCGKLCPLSYSGRSFLMDCVC